MVYLSIIRAEVELFLLTVVEPFHIFERNFELL